MIFGDEKAKIVLDTSKKEGLTKTSKDKRSATSLSVNLKKLKNFGNHEDEKEEHKEHQDYHKNSINILPTILVDEPSEPTPREITL